MYGGCVLSDHGLSLSVFMPFSALTLRSYSLFLAFLRTFSVFVSSSPGTLGMIFALAIFVMERPRSTSSRILKFVFFFTFFCISKGLCLPGNVVIFIVSWVAVGLLASVIVDRLVLYL